ncbi:hypothetical protein MMMDOFMJ_1475 [Methylobacterium gnaphalii]|uniref:Uncharacterized protein n=2 Tax=Methylobacterium gnaphalii TaxID=1010610 RepID=A0A512JLS8_9HYPH|nr:hypothetical protein MGN01_27560 [Methylobacterium gnaphalii]GJD68551.1 hypothetical protein MMMDOFMJ_1475 [Methylobacterium gnaphalii]GLS50643.1 hypothetical protein GCM10007885_34970 [Methylobacterium gnaphalii]
MSDVEKQFVTEAISDVEKIRERLGSHGTFKLRVLLEMVVIELKNAQSFIATASQPDTPSEL